MTGGNTAHGLPYPGGNDPVYNVPAYLQNLAMAIDNKIQNKGTPRVFASYVALINCTMTGAPPTGIANVNYLATPTIRWVRGFIMSRQTWSGGTSQALILRAFPHWATQETWNQSWWNRLGFYVHDPAVKLGTAPQQYPGAYVGNAGVSILAWGDPNPPGG